MRYKKSLFRQLYVLLFLGLLNSCTTSKKIPDIFPVIALTPDDKNIIFPFYIENKVRVYQLNIDSNEIITIINPRIGTVAAPFVTNIALELYYIFVENISNHYQYTIRRNEINGKNEQILLTLNQPILDIAVSPADERIYFITAKEIGHSSPIVGTAPRIMDIYSVDAQGQDMRRETTFNAYTIFGRLSFDETGRYVYLNINFINDKMESGPYRFDLELKKLAYLMPNELIGLNKKFKLIGSDMYKRFVLPTPSRFENIIFLNDATIVYIINKSNTGGKIFYEQEHEKKYTTQEYINYILPFNHSNRILLYKDLGSKNSLYIINASGKIEKTIEPDTANLRKLFLSR